mmetsp:Transcript_44909/g.70264  ORF Transcript_44909/g.70264 Transcript_44909/m.70264 type:complete len:203 (-) Transcript_44909:1020-1628(-)
MEGDLGEVPADVHRAGLAAGGGRHVDRPPRVLNERLLEGGVAQGVGPPAGRIVGGHPHVILGVLQQAVHSVRLLAGAHVRRALVRRPRRGGERIPRVPLHVVPEDRGAAVVAGRVPAHREHAVGGHPELHVQGVGRLLVRRQARRRAGRTGPRTLAVHRLHAHIHGHPLFQVREHLGVRAALGNQHHARVVRLHESVVVTGP